MSNKTISNSGTYTTCNNEPTTLTYDSILEARKKIVDICNKPLKEYAKTKGFDLDGSDRAIVAKDIATTYSFYEEENIHISPYIDNNIFFLKNPLKINKLGELTWTKQSK